MAKTLSSCDLAAEGVPLTGHVPFIGIGGTKATGNGHGEAGIQALDVFSEWKSCYIDFSGTLQRAQIDW